MKRAIFISYRRDDAEGEAGRLFDDLVRAYGDDSVFMDVAGIAPGLDFRKAIDDNVSGCGVFLAIIGPQWATIAGANGERRLEDANDFVRLEIASALARNIAVIPVLVHEAHMPHPEQLPDNIKDLAYRNSVEISHARWNSDVQLLIEALKQYVETTRATQTDPVHATIPVQLPPPVSPHPAPEPKSSKMPLILGGSAAAILLLAVIGYFIAHHGTNNQNAQTGSSAVTPAAPASTPEGDAAALAGNWRNINPQSGVDTLRALRITGTAPRFTAEALGDCAQGQCSWGVQKVIFGGADGIVTFSPRNTPQEIRMRRSVLMTMRRAGDKLDVDVMNTWWNEEGKTQQNHYTFEFERAK